MCLTNWRTWRPSPNSSESYPGKSGAQLVSVCLMYASYVNEIIDVPRTFEQLRTEHGALGSLASYLHGKPLEHSVVAALLYVIFEVQPVGAARYGTVC